MLQRTNDRYKALDMNGTTSSGANNECGLNIINGKSAANYVIAGDPGCAISTSSVKSAPIIYANNHHLNNNNNNNAMWKMASDVDGGPSVIETSSSSKGKQQEQQQQQQQTADNGALSNLPMMDHLDGTDRISAVQNAVLTAISELERLQNGGVPTKTIVLQDPRYLELTKEKPVKLQVRILVPVKDHPKFNFVGKLLGPKGNSLKRLQEDTLTKMAILGRGSMRDKAKEAELRQLNDPKFAHLSEELHVEISTFAPPAEAYARISHAMAEIKRFLVPDYNDDIRQDQLRELAYISGKVVPVPPPPPPPPPPQHRRTGGPAPPPSLVAAAARTTRVGLLATPSGRAVAARSGAVPAPGTRTLLRAAPGSRAATYRTAVVPEARLRADEGYVYEDGYAYPSTYDDDDPYYEYTSGAAAIDPYPEEFSSGDEWRLNNDSSRLKAPRPATRPSFRDHPYAPQPASSVAPATSRF